MTEPLWSDERIQARRGELRLRLSEGTRHKPGPRMYTMAAMERLVVEMRDSYEQRIEHLETAFERIRAEMEEARAVPATEKYAAGLLRALEILLESENNDD